MAPKTSHKCKLKCNNRLVVKHTVYIHLGSMILFAIEFGFIYLIRRIK